MAKKMENHVRKVKIRKSQNHPAHAAEEGLEVGPPSTGRIRN